MALILDIFQNLPTYLHLWAVDYGAGLYLILFAIIFAETGLVVTPLLPGDSLLFATGALLSLGLPGLDVWIMIPLLILAALLGDTVNYHVGKYMAPKLFKNDQSRWLNRKYLERTTEFYVKHGGKTVILARFMPIVRTYAPFVAGLTGMKYAYYFTYCVIGAVTWISSFVLLGYFFGNIPSIKSNFHYVIMAILVVSVMPVVIEFVKARRVRRPASDPVN